MKYKFPEFTGVKCHMMPIIQGRPETLPPHMSQYAGFVEQFVLEDGEEGALTVDESFVECGKTQRGYGRSSRSLHTEGTLFCGGVAWGPKPAWGGTRITMKENTRILLSNSIDDTCMVWDACANLTYDGDLSDSLHLYPMSDGRLLKAGEVCEIGVRTPHEPLQQIESGNRQFVRLVGSGIDGRVPGHTVNQAMA